jgi:hypothetical protein
MTRRSGIDVEMPGIDVEHLLIFYLSVSLGVGRLPVKIRAPSETKNAQKVAKKIWVL